MTTRQIGLMYYIMKELNKILPLTLNKFETLISLQMKSIITQWELCLNTLRYVIDLLLYAQDQKYFTKQHYLKFDELLGELTTE